MMIFLMRRSSLALLAIATLATSCESGSLSNSTSPDAASGTIADQGVGTLEFRANGEDFVRQGFTSSDGWAIQFDHVYVTLSDLTAFAADSAIAQADGAEPQLADTQADNQTDDQTKALHADKAPKPGDVQHSQPMGEASAAVAVDGAQTVDLAAGDEQAETILVQSLDAPATQFKGLAWNLVPAPTGPAEGNVIQLVGQAEKEGRTIDFVIGWDQPYAYACGEFVGDERKGIVKSGEAADVEATFHFDHIFGDGEAPADDEINTGAAGFEPFAALAQGDRVEVNRETLEAQLPPEDYATLQKTFAGLGHVGEGHCDAQVLDL